MHLQVFPRITAAASTAAETQEDEGESSGQEYESATDTEEVGDTLGEGDGEGEEGDLGDLGDAPLAELMCMEQSECDQVWIYNYSLASLCLTYHSLVIRALSAE